MLDIFFDKVEELSKLSLEMEVQLIELQELINNYQKGINES